MRLAVLGNSHGACLRQAISDGLFDPQAAGISVEFFFSPSLTLNKLVRRDHHLVAEDTDLVRKMKLVGCDQTDLDTRDYDVFLVMGLQLIVEPADPFISDAVMWAAVRSQVHRTANWKLTANKLRRATDRPVFIGHQPMPAHTSESFREKHPRVAPYGQTMARYAAHYAEIDCHMLPQPSDTLSEAGGALVTPQRFTLGSRLLLKDRPHEATDIDHMNAEYGAIYWRALLHAHQKAAA